MSVDRRISWSPCWVSSRSGSRSPIQALERLSEITERIQLATERGLTPILLRPHAATPSCSFLIALLIRTRPSFIRSPRADTAHSERASLSCTAHAVHSRVPHRQLDVASILRVAAGHATPHAISRAQRHMARLSAPVHTSIQGTGSQTHSFQRRIENPTNLATAVHGRMSLAASPRKRARTALFISVQRSLVAPFNSHADTRAWPPWRCFEPNGPAI